MKNEKIPQKTKSIKERKRNLHSTTFKPLGTIS
jgi:hypothetical protein